MSIQNVKSRPKSTNGVSNMAGNSGTSFIELEKKWFLDTLKNSIHFHAKGIKPAKDLQPPSVKNWKHPYPELLKRLDLGKEERLILMLGLLPHIQPHKMDEVIAAGLERVGDFPQIGGVRGKNFRGFLPTGETALYLLAGHDLEKRFKIQQYFTQEHALAKNQILWLEDPINGEPAMSGKIVMDPDHVELLTLATVHSPRFGINFPALKVETKMDWEDLVLPGDTMQQIKELENWIQYGDELLLNWGMNKKIKPGYRVLFHGPPGTGKTLTASLLGKYTGHDVYKIDLSLVVSKFIGETEKNLANLFDKAENKNWILFFDEADALFGKRTSVRDAHDKYANQEVSFLLQRTETYSGLVILATNFKSNIDDAFSRRFQSHIYFPHPKYNERLALWQKSLPEGVKLENKINLTNIAKQYDLTGAHIMNVVQYACLQSLASGQKQILLEDLVNGIRKELSKEGKAV